MKIGLVFSAIPSFLPLTPSEIQAYKNRLIFQARASCRVICDRI